MSRSNPTEATQNPSTRWFEWSGSEGVIRYYDKEKKETIEVGDKFTFLLLDSLSCVKGWHEPSESGIYSNEVRDTRSERMVVKAFKGGTIAEGFYSDIKDRVKAQGGRFNSNLYLAYKDSTGNLQLGALTLSGAGLMSWMEFSKANRKGLNEGAVQINGSDEGKKGSVKFKTPRFSIIPVSEAANDAAIALDTDILQPYLSAYLKKNKAEPQEQEYEPEDEGTEAQRKQQAEWQAAEEQDRRQKAGGDTKLRELANRPSNSGSVPGVVNEGWDDSDPENQLPF